MTTVPASGRCLRLGWCGPPHRPQRAVQVRLLGLCPGRHAVATGWTRRGRAPASQSAAFAAFGQVGLGRGRDTFGRSARRTSVPRTQFQHPALPPVPATPMSAMSRWLGELRATCGTSDLARPLGWPLDSSSPIECPCRPTEESQCEQAGCDSEHRLSTEARGVKR
jgi:hypothetical protein